MVDETAGSAGKRAVSNVSSPDACEFFTLDDVLRWAAEAFRGARHDIRPPQGEPWMVDGHAWSGPANFAYSVHARFTRSVNRHAKACRVINDCGYEGERFGWDDTDFLYGAFSGPEGNGLPPHLDRPEDVYRKGVSGGR
jgi:hypothetical protein